MIPFIVLVLAAVLILPAQLIHASPTTYYTSASGSDSNAGTQTAPFRTIMHGVSALKPGDTLLVRDGTYAEEITDIPSGTSWSAPVTLKAYPGETVTIKPNSGANRVLEFSAYENQQYIIVDGFILDGTNVGYDAVKFEENTASGVAHDIKLINSEVRNAPQQGVLTNTDTNNLYFGNLTIHDNGTSDFHHGIYIKNSGTVIENSRIYRNAGWGVHLYGGTDNNNIVRNNMIYSNARIGGRGAGVGVYTGSGTQVYNNVIYGNKEGIELNYGASSSGIYNNTIYNNADYAILVGSDASGTVLRNNILYQSSTLVENDGSGTTSDHNLSGTDPKFANASAGDFDLTSGSPAINTGVTISSVPTDMEGVSRPQGSAYDLGACEYKSGGTSPTATATATARPSTSTPAASATATVRPPTNTPQTVQPTNTPGASQGIIPASGGSNWKMIFDDDFDTFDSTKWDKCYYWGTNGGCTSANGELEWYQPGDVWTWNGELNLQAEHRSVNGYQYTSGMIDSYGHFAFTYGYMEARIQIPKGQGLWPAFWAIPTDRWPPEIDAMEILGNDPSTTYFGFHYVNSSGSNDHYGTQWTGPDFSAGYHTFGVDWEPDGMVYYIDGVEHMRYATTSNIPNVPLYLVANLAVGGDWPGSPASTTPFPSIMKVDYIRVWQRCDNCSGTTPTTVPTSAPTTAPTTAPTNAPTVQPTTAAGTHGLTAAYYDNNDFTNLKVTRVDPAVNFQWWSGSPDASIGSETFSARWTGQVQPLYTQPYTFYVNSDDGARLWVNGQLVVDSWGPHGPTEASGTISLTAGTKYNIQMDYHEDGGDATAILSWSSTSQAKQVIPQAQLYPTSATGPTATPAAPTPTVRPPTNTPIATGTVATVAPSKTTQPTIAPTSTISQPPPRTDGAFKVQYLNANTSLSANQITPHFNIINLATSVASMTSLKLRYYFTKDGGGSLVWNCDYAVIGCGSISATFVTLNPPVSGADTYLEIGFTGGQIPASLGSSGEIQARITKSDWSAFNQSDDYSFSATQSSWGDWSKVTLYQNGVSVWGMAPGGSIAPTATAVVPSPTSTVVRTNTPVPGPTQTVVPSATVVPPTKTLVPTTAVPTASASTLKVQYMDSENPPALSDNQFKPYFNIVNLGSSSIPLSALKIRYYFTRDNSQPLVFNCDYAVVNCANVTGTFAVIIPATATADAYLEIGFTSAAGSIAANGQSGAIQVRASHSDWSAFNETNDYSYDGTKLTFADWNHVTLWLNGQMVWGAPPV